MMRSMKDAGFSEVARLRKRVMRSNAMGRIGDADCAFIKKRLDEIEARIVEMQEDDPKAKEF